MAIATKGATDSTQVTTTEHRHSFELLSAVNYSPGYSPGLFP